MMKLISIIKSFLFGDTEQERTQDTTLREDIEFEERPQYIPPMDNKKTAVSLSDFRNRTHISWQEQSAISLPKMD